MMTTNEMGFKLVDADNVLAPDAVSVDFHILTPLGARPMGSDDWIAAINEVQLCEGVPLVVRRAFMMARNAMCYAHWYYPVLTLMVQQLLRVADFANGIACQGYGINTKWPLAKRTAALCEAGAIPKEQAGLWEGLRRQRNHCTHPNFQEVWPPGMVIETARHVAEAINTISWV